MATSNDPEQRAWNAMVPPVVPAFEVVNISRTSSPRNGFAVIAGGARLCARLEGWPRVRALRPSFETLASQAPQDEVSIFRRCRLRTLASQAQDEAGVPGVVVIYSTFA